MSGKKNISEFVQLTRPHHRQLYGIALALCRDADQAADLAQETLVRAFEAFEQFRPGSPILPWLRRILRNLFLDSFKTGRARHEVPESALAHPDSLPLPEVADEGEEPLARLERAQLSSWLREEMGQLEPEHQQVLTLCVMNDLAFKEAAELTGLPVGTIASRLARARARLRERMLNKIAGLRQCEREDGAAALVDGNQAPSRIHSGSAEEAAPGASEEEPDRAEEASS